MSATHTPTPWRVLTDQPSHGCCLTIESDTNVIARTPEVESYDCEEQRTIDLPNAEFIVKACNAHDDLVAALEIVAAGNTDPDRMVDIATAVLAQVRA